MKSEQARQWLPSLPTFLLALVTYGCLNACGGNAGQLAGTVRMQTSAWGGYQQGLECRVLAPIDIEEGMPIRAVVQIRSDPKKLERGIKSLNAFRPAVFLSLLLTNEANGELYRIQPFDSTEAPLAWDFGKAIVPLDGTRTPAWQVSFPLVKLYRLLAPGTYQCAVEYTFPTNQTRGWRQGDAAWSTAGFWHGTVVSGIFSLTVRPETRATQTFLVPRRLRLVKELTSVTEGSDARLVVVPKVRFASPDAEKLSVKLRNGHSLGTKCRFIGGGATSSTISGPPKPDDVNAIDMWSNYHGGDRKEEITMELFETADPPHHFWSPGPGAQGYRVLWTNTFRISLIDGSFRRQSAMALDLSKSHTLTDAGLAVLDQNRLLESLSLGNTAITDAGLARVARLAHLRTLMLYDTAITDAGLKCLKGLTNLHALNLAGTRVTEAGVANLEDLVHLESLDLARTSVTDSVLAALSAMVHLKFLNLTQTRVGDAGLIHLRSLANLELLFLSDTPVSDAGIPYLKELPSLKSLRLNGSRVSDTAVDELLRALPECMIER
jgi:hypothetical protein